jgi:hypothetical protein
VVSLLIAETDPAYVPLDFAEVRFAAASTAVTAGHAVSAELPRRHAGLIRLAGQSKACERHSYKAAGESFQGLPPRDGLGHSSGQLIEFVVHDFFLRFLYGLVPQAMRVPG